MRQFITYLFIVAVLFGSFFVEDQALSKVEKQKLLPAQSDSGSYFSAINYFSSNNSATKETHPSLTSPLLPFFNSLLFSETFIEKRVELAMNNEMSDYQYRAEYHIIRFEGSAIIHPFNYFW